MFTGLTNDFLLLLSGLLLVLSMVQFQRGKELGGIAILFLASIAIASFMAGLDPFLNLWDEQFHALVAKNLIKHPLKPTLYEHPVLGYDYRIWSGNHVWLHKQPMFLWQIALSIYWFGANEWSVRLPDIIMHGLLTLMVFRIGKIAVNSRAGFYAAILFTFAYFPLELVVGKFATDHNDSCFLFYVGASFWSWFEYMDFCHRRWIVAIGVFSGMAVLVKWLVGWLVFPMWFMVLVWKNREHPFQLRPYSPLLLSFLICCCIFLPWQWYIIQNYTTEAWYEYGLNTRHFFEAVENHGGDVWFHWKALKYLYAAGDLVPYLLLFSLVYLLKRIGLNYRLMVAGSIFLVYGFYTLATTKMVSFCLIVSPFVFLSLGTLIEGIESWLTGLVKTGWMVKLFVGIVLLAGSYGLLDFHKIKSNHSMVWADLKDERFPKLAQRQFINLVETQLPKQTHVVFNADVTIFGQIPLMFYTQHIGYDFIPDSMQVIKAKRLQFPLAIRDDGNLPEFILQDPEIKKIQFP
ncbi:MAG: glycosyltransferase family 39 protein [Bacteroidia bacterium]|nr:glycosyltransferase family 39 protein [Bacteroidia bacterium]